MFSIYLTLMKHKFQFSATSYHCYGVFNLLSLLLQVIVVQFAGRVFSTVPVTLEQWCWCFAFGVGELIWGQVQSSLVKSASKALSLMTHDS